MSHSIRQPFRLATAFRLCFGRVAGCNGAHDGANPADHSAMTRALVEQSVCVPHCEEHHGEPNSLRVSATARGPDSGLRMQVSTARAAPLGLLPAQHMACGTILLTIKYLWRALLTHWSAPHHRYLPQKPCSLLGLGTRLKPIFNVELAQRMDPQRCVRC